MGAHAGSDCLPVSRAKPIVGVCDVAIAPMNLAMRLSSLGEDETYRGSGYSQIAFGIAAH